MPPTTTLRIHQLVLRDKYRVERLLGVGATAEVYEVSRPDGRGKRALKAMRLTAGSGPADLEAQRQRFSWEYDLGQDFMSHPRIVHSLDFEFEGELPVLVMEFMPGGSLRAELDAADGRRLAWKRCAEVLRDVAEGLGALHAAGLVHRDVKPSNVLLDANRRARIGDLGVVQTNNTVTRTDGVGHPHPRTPGYESPEHGNSLAVLSPAADVYGLGATGFEMLTGRVPPLTTASRPPSEIGRDAPEWLKALIHRMLDYDYRERPQDGAEVAEMLARDLQAEAERAAHRAARTKALRSQIEVALKAGELGRAAELVNELSAGTPDAPEVSTLGIQVYLAIQAETKRAAEAEQKRLADEAAQRKREEQERQRLAAIDAEQKRLADEAARLEREEEERQRLAAIDAEQKRLADEAARLKREEEERQRLALVAAAEAKRKAEASQRLRRISADRAALLLAPGLEMEFVRVPAGEFLMGSDKAKDSLAHAGESPQHRLKLPEYWIGKAPVTVAQFAAFVKSASYKTQAEKDGKSYTWNGSEWKDVAGADWAHPGGPVTDVSQKQSHPVNHMSWDDGIAFCDWVSKLGGGEVLLPSEAEWEKAARGTDGRIYPWGNEAPDDTRLNYNMTVKDTTPVGKYGAKGQTRYGCDDMAGNVSEWTRSLQRAYPYATDDGRENLASRDFRVLRGGSFGFDAQDVRCVYRYGHGPYIHFGLIGFRVILRPPSFG